MLSWLFGPSKSDPQSDTSHQIALLRQELRIIAQGMVSIILKLETHDMSALTDAFTAALDQRLAEMTKDRADAAAAANAIAAVTAERDEANVALQSALDKLNAV